MKRNTRKQETENRSCKPHARSRHLQAYFAAPRTALMHNLYQPGAGRGAMSEGGAPAASFEGFQQSRTITHGLQHPNLKTMAMDKYYLTPYWQVTPRILVGNRSTHRTPYIYIIHYTPLPPLDASCQLAVEHGSQALGKGIRF